MKVMIPSSNLLTASNISVTAYPQWLIGTNYALNAIVSSQGVSKGEFQAMVANIGKNPEDPLNIYDATNNPTGTWKFLSTQNRFKCFDQYLNTQAVNAGTITMTVSAYGAQALYLGNIDAIDVTISVINNVGGATIETATVIGIITEPTSHEEYGFGDWIDETQGNVTYERTTLTRDVSFVITINGGAGTAKLGILATGSTREIGEAQWGAELSSLDYSTVITDSSTGATFLSKGNNAKSLSPRLMADTAQIEAYYRTLTKIQGQPIVLIDDFNILSSYCYLQKFKQSLTDPTKFTTDTDFIGLI